MPILVCKVWRKLGCLRQVCLKFTLNNSIFEKTKILNLTTCIAAVNMKWKYWKSKLQIWMQISSRKLSTCFLSHQNEQLLELSDRFSQTAEITLSHIRKLKNWKKSEELKELIGIVILNYNRVASFCVQFKSKAPDFQTIFNLKSNFLKTNSSKY